MKMAILGSNGFLGLNLYAYLKSYHKIDGITRSNYAAKRLERFDIFINADGNANRYWANEHILEDFEASTRSLYKTFFDFKPSKLYIYISSADVYPDHEDISKTDEAVYIDARKLCPYGLHKHISEELVKRYAKNFLILRCSAIIGKGMKKGSIKDILDGAPLYTTLDPKLQLIDAFEISRIIELFIRKGLFNEIFNVGGIGALSLEDLEEFFLKKFTAKKGGARQIYEMKVDKLKNIYPLKASREYLLEYLDIRRNFNDK